MDTQLLANQELNYLICLTKHQIHINKKPAGEIPALFKTQKNKPLWNFQKKK